MRIFGRVIALINLSFACCSLLPSIAAQVDEHIVEKPASIPSDADWVNKDYFEKDRDQQVNGLLRLVERNHFDKANFWKWYSSGHLQYALNELQYVLWVFPNHPPALLLLAEIAKSTKKPSLGMVYYQKALKLYPQHALTHAQYGSYLVDVNLTDSGIEKLKEAIEIDPTVVVGHVWLAKAYYKGGHPDLAREAAEQARRLGYRGKIPGEPPGKSS